MYIFYGSCSQNDKYVKGQSIAVHQYAAEMTKFYITANTLDLVRDLEDFYNIKSLKSVIETILKSKSKSLYVK